MPIVKWTLEGTTPDTKSSSLNGSESNDKGENSEKSPRVVVEPLPLGEPLKDDDSSWWSKKKTVDLDAIATQRSVYDDPEVAKLYQPRSDWENLHRFDPSARWTWREEKVHLPRTLSPTQH